VEKAEEEREREREIGGVVGGRGTLYFVYT
jgi:hypothetical protein